MKILICDPVDEKELSRLNDVENVSYDVRTGMAVDELKETVKDYDAMVVRSATKVTAGLLEAATNLKVIGRAGIGLDNVDIPAATKKGIAVMNTPEGNVVTTAEHAIAMMLSLSRNIPTGTTTMKDGLWEKKRLQGREIFNKVLGIVGFGKIGSIVADRARGLKMKVVVYDPHIAPEQIESSGFESVSLEGLYRRSDYISVHVPKMEITLTFLEKKPFGLMKEGVKIINCARGGIVNESDLHAAIVSGKVAGAALDVFAVEPPGENPLFDLDRVICTPHLGASTREAQTNVAVSVAEQIIAFLKTGTIVNAVNVPSVTGELLEKIGPLLELGEKMGVLQTQLIKGPVKEVTIAYEGDFQKVDLTPVSTAVMKGLMTRMVTDEVNFINARALAKEMGIKVKETSTAESKDYANLLTVHVRTTEMANSVSGTIFGKKDPRVIKINNFRLELIPQGHMALIYNIDRPGSIGEIGTTLGAHAVNIGRMQVGQEEGGDHNIIFMQTDTRIDDATLSALNDLGSVKSIVPLEF